MSAELIAILVTAALQTAGIVALGVMIYRLPDRFSAGEAAIFRQTKKLQETIEEMRQALR